MPRFEAGEPIPTLRSDGDTRQYILNECCITAAAWECLSELYCNPPWDTLWAIDPCTPLASIACRDESQLRSGVYRFAHSVWVAAGTEAKPLKLVGLVNFRPIGSRLKSYKDMQISWNLGCAEAFLRLPTGWNNEEAPIVDKRYLRALTPALCPDVPGKFLEGVNIRPAIETIPYSSQWSASGTCGPTSTFMVALQMCLPDRGHMKVEGPFSISCLAEDVRENLKIEHPSSTEKARQRRLRLDLHEEHFRKYDWSNRPPEDVHLFRLEGTDLQTLSETLRIFLGDTESQSEENRKRVIFPTYITSGTARKEPERDRSLKLEEFRRTIESALASGIPVMVNVDLDLVRAASIVASPPGRYEQKTVRACEERLKEAGDFVFNGVELLDLPKGWASDSTQEDYDPLELVHCVVVVGRRNLLGGDDGNHRCLDFDSSHGVVLFHDPFFGPYREASITDFYVAANLPYMRLIPGFRPMIGMVVPIPYRIGFDLHQFSDLDVAKHNAIADLRIREQMEALLRNPSDQVEWRVRILPKNEVWNSYFAKSGAIEEPEVFQSLLPPYPHVLCLEVFRTSKDALKERPQTVVFAYMPPGERQTAETIKNPKPSPAPEFTGCFGVDRSEVGPAQVIFFQTQDDVWVPVPPILECDDLVATSPFNRR